MKQRYLELPEGIVHDWDKKIWGDARLRRAARRLAQLAGCMVVALVFAAGCGESEEVKDTYREGQITIKRLAILYGRYLGSHGGKPPQDEATFRDFVEKNKQGVTAPGADEGGDLLVSPRDGKPYVIPYADSDKKLVDAGVAAYEQEGIGGKRMVAFTIGAVEEVDQAGLDKILAGEGMGGP